MLPPPPSSQNPHILAQSSYDSSSYGNNESCTARMQPIPRSPSTRGDHHQQHTSYREPKPLPQSYHPYGRAFSGVSGFAPYHGEQPSRYQSFRGYDYYGGVQSLDSYGMMLYRQGHLNHSLTPPRQHSKGLPDCSPDEDGESIGRPSSAMNNLHQQQMTPGKSKLAPQTKDEKKPPRPYTEYNIFFQLERERILGELEKERNGGGDDDADADGIKNEKVFEEGGIVDLTPSSKDEDDKTHDDRKYHTPSSPGIVLNRPSDSNDVVPRPDRFAHLQLAPLWYDSAHRLAQSKLNKSRRRHRKTHGLVGFLELTKRIATAWSEIDPETKAYCKNIADRQLKIYKEEMKMVKKTQTTPMDDPGENIKIVGNGDSGGVSMQKQTNAQVHQQMMQRMQEATAVAAGGFFEGMRNTMGRPHESKMIPPTSPSRKPGPSRSGGSTAQPILHHWWLQHHQNHQQQGLYPHSHQAQSQHRDGNPPKQTYEPPAIPPLTPTSLEYNNERIPGYYGGGDGDVKHSALEELMYRRKLYGSRTAESQGPRRSPGTSRQERSLNIAKQVITTEDDSGENNKPHHGENDKSAVPTGLIKPTDSYLSPSNLEVSPYDDFHKMSTMAITPSPSRLQVELPPHVSKSRLTNSAIAAEPAAEATMTPSSLPMKKRRKMLKREESASVDSDPSAATPGFCKDTSLTPGSTTFSYAKDGFSPNFAGSDISPMSLLSPSAMITPGLKFGATPLSGGLHHRKVLADDYMTSTPLPYIDWGSPHDNSPEEAGSGHEHGMNNRFMMFPPHLGVPGRVTNSEPPGSRYYSSGSSPYPSNPYLPGQSHLMTNAFNREGAFDLDDEVKIMWRELATHAKQRQMRERDVAMAWMYSQYGNDNLKMAHSFASPVEGPDLVAGGTSQGPGPASRGGNIGSDCGDDNDKEEVQVPV
ncbi:hypothetical protein ACHAW5_009838 [Stephanodiscus triporus]|uniref:HMG box domain-containing protein n=1 Tax=Stephanodiscus triporus TaxID=2934178 RepID=A0ABD3QCU7_9STRA